MNQNMIIRLTALLLFSVGALSGCQQEQNQQGALARGPVEVEVVTLEPQPVELESELPGRTSAYRVAEVRPQVNGIIQERFFTEGSEVEAGDLLYQIDPATYRAAYESAKAALAKAEALEHSARLKAERYNTLAKTNAVSEIDRVDYEATWKQAQAEVAAARANLNRAGINLEYTKITAPISGRIGKSMISEGALVTAQQATPLAIIQQLNPLYVDLTQSSSELLRLKKEIAAGQLAGGEQLHSGVTLILEDGTSYPHQASLAFSDVTVNRTTGSVTVRAIVSNPEEELLPGMYVRAKVIRGVKEDAILVPAAAISRNPKGQTVVMLVNGDSKVESRIIESEQNMGNMVLVGSGLSGGEKLITAGLQYIKPGVPVTAVQKTSPGAGQMAMRAGKNDTAGKME